MSAASGLSRLAWLSVAAALGTIALKTLAWALTGSVGFSRMPRSRSSTSRPP
jgi:hypothetical protein